MSAVREGGLMSPVRASPSLPAMLPTIALVGNPNTGKTTLFNRLTGSRQRVGNYPGVTVARRSGQMWLESRKAEALDLPGAYSLAAGSPDERIACDVLTGRAGAAPELVVCTVDANHLQRGLFLACQVADFGAPMVIVVNFMDEAESKGVSIDCETLSMRLGVPVVPISARYGHGLLELDATLKKSLTAPPRMALPAWDPEVGRSTGRIAGRIPEGRTFSAPELRRMLFDNDSSLLDLSGIARGERAAVLAAARSELSAAHPLAYESTAHHAFLHSALEGVVTRGRPPKPELTRAMDRILTHRILGLAIFIGLMFFVFQSIYTLATPAMSMIEALAGWLSDLAGRHLDGLPLFRSLICDGIIAGVGGVVVFLPQIFLLFFFISLLEGTGYMARAAFLMDRLFGWCGLNGKSFVPLLSSYACAVPGLYATRTIEDPKARLLTILIAPLMSCSARLPVYLLMIGAFVAPAYGAGVAAGTLLAFHLLGLVVALPVAWVTNRWLLKIPAQPFVLEMPPYRTPGWRDTLWRTWLGGRDFLQRAGGIILALSILIWALLSFPRASSGEAPPDPTAQVENSYLGQAGRALQPIFAPAGFDWKLTLGVLASFPAREVIVSTLGIIYRLEGNPEDDPEPLIEALRNAKWTAGPRTGQPVFTIATAFSLMVFFALCMQCASTLVVISREAGVRYAVITFVYMTTLAWLSAVVTYQTLSRVLP